MRVIAYYRVSTTQQRDADTIASQRLSACALCKSRGWKLVREFEDDGRTASKQLAKRTGFLAFLDAVRAGEADAVLIIAFDRLTRSADLAEQGMILGTIQAAKIPLFVGSGEEMDLSTFGGRVSATVRAQLAAEESAVKRERTLRGRARTAAEGRPPGKPPWGLEYVPGEGWKTTWAAAIVKEMYERVVAGESTEQIAADMCRRGIPTPRRTFLGKTPRWRRSTVYDIVVREVYRGKWRANHEINIDVPRIVDDRLWGAAQEALLVAKRRGLRRTRSVYLLEAIGRCGLCKGRINIRLSGDKSSPYRYYYCENRYRGSYGERCALPMHRIEQVDERVWAAVSKVLVSRVDLVAEATLRRDHATNPDVRLIAADLKEWKSKLGGLDESESDVMMLCRRGLLSHGARDRELIKITQLRRVLAQQIETATALLSESTPLMRNVSPSSEVCVAIDSASLEQRRDAVRAVISGFHIGVDEIVGHMQVCAQVEGERGKHELATT